MGREGATWGGFNRLIMSGFFEEVQRRKVYRVAAAYIIAAGVYHPDRLGCFSGVGTAKLDAAPGYCASVNRFSDRVDPGLGF